MSTELKQNSNTPAADKRTSVPDCVDDVEDVDFDLAPSDEERDRVNSDFNGLLDKIAEGLAQIQLLQRQQESRLEKLETLTRELSEARRNASLGGLLPVTSASTLEPANDLLVEIAPPTEGSVSRKNRGSANGGGASSKPVKKQSSRRKTNNSPLKAVTQEDLHRKRKQEKSARKMATNQTSRKHQKDDEEVVNEEDFTLENTL